MADTDPFEDSGKLPGPSCSSPSRNQLPTVFSPPFTNVNSIMDFALDEEVMLHDHDIEKMFGIMQTSNSGGSTELDLDDWLVDDERVTSIFGPGMEEHTMEHLDLPISKTGSTNVIETDELCSLPITSSSSEVNDAETTYKNHNDDEDEATSEQHLFKEYELRPQARATRSLFSTTWIDQDDTGDYGDQQTERLLRENRLRRARNRKRKRDRMASNSEDAVNGEGIPQCNALEIPTLEVILKFSIDTGRLKLEEAALHSSARAVLRDDEQSDGYQLRRRTCGNRAASETADLTGHPSARGCRACLKLDLRCSLLDDEDSWPCHACTEDGEDCELIISPTVKRACQRCKSRKAPCSFNLGDRQGKACQECMDVGQWCIAGPVKEFIRPRLSYDWDWENDPFLRNKAIRLLEAPCRLKGETHEQDFGLKEAIPSNLASQTKVDAVPAKPKLSVTAPNHSKATSCKQDQGIRKTIATKFCHPIKFNYVRKTADERPCHFCSELALPVLGLPSKQVEVIEWKDGRGLEEVSGGYKDMGVENTRVCASCTLKRVPIIMCSNHKLVPLPKPRRANENNAALIELSENTPKPNTKWCSICPTLAQYECSQVFDDCRCGLLLCEYDMMVLSSVYNGDLQKMLAQIKDKPPKNRKFGLRADVGFLRQDGLLMKFVVWNSRQ